MSRLNTLVLQNLTIDTHATVDVGTTALRLALYASRQDYAVHMTKWDYFVQHHKYHSFIWIKSKWFLIYMIIYAIILLTRPGIEPGERSTTTLPGRGLLKMMQKFVTNPVFILAFACGLRLGRAHYILQHWPTLTELSGVDRSAQTRQGHIKSPRIHLHTPPNPTCSRWYDHEWLKADYKPDSPTHLSATWGCARVALWAEHLGR